MGMGDAKQAVRTAGTGGDATGFPSATVFTIPRSRSPVSRSDNQCTKSSSIFALASVYPGSGAPTDSGAEIQRR